MINFLKGIILNREYGYSEDIDGEIHVRVWAYMRKKDGVTVFYKTIVKKNGKKIYSMDLK